jgi:hypothetical protein
LAAALPGPLAAPAGPQPSALRFVAGTLSLVDVAQP